MTNNAPDYEDNLAFEPAKTAGTMATIARDGKAVAIRCYIDNQHYFDLALKDAAEKMTWYEAKLWCEEHYCRLPMKHEMKFIAENLDAVNKMLKSVGGKPLKGEYWSSSEYDNYGAWYSTFGDSDGLDWGSKGYDGSYVRPVLAL
jgi:hypothetical protein